MRLRLLIVVTHLLGAGHLTRAAALARAFARAGHDVVLASGGMPAALVGTEGVTLVQLPPVQTAGTDFRTLLDETGHPVAPSRLEARREMLLDQVAEMRPDVIVTELFPFGRRILAGEFMGVIEAAKASRPDTLVLASVRDILVSPAKAERIVEAHERLRRFYDAVLVHGDPDLVRLDASWPLDGAAQALVRYTGYVDDGAPVEATALDGGAILVSGGSSAASLPLYRAAAAAAALVPETRWRILVGRGVAEAAFAALRASAPANAVVERARPDFRALLAAAAVSVSQAGYNTVMDVLRARVRAIFVPFEQGHETEQRLRAERLADTGIGTIIAEPDLSPPVLAERVREAVSQPHAPASPISLDGAERSVAIIEELAAARSRPGRRRSEATSPWNALDDALNRAGDAGVTIPFWWRDDDAVAHTPALDRLLALARSFDVPLVLAGIPAKVEDSLVQRLHDEPPHVAVTVHGLSHGNHAPEGAKKAEFGPHRPLLSLVEDAREGLRLAHRRLGDRLAPIFVPPWNRIAPDLTALLPSLGFAGLSTFGERIAREPAPDLLQVNTHVDPIDWHQGGRIRDLEALLAEITALISRRVAHDIRDPEPIGLLTHHLVHNEAIWAFCEKLLSRVAAQRSVRFPDVRAMFVGAQTSAT